MGDVIEGVSSFYTVKQFVNVEHLLGIKCRRCTKWTNLSALVSKTMGLLQLL